NTRRGRRPPAPARRSSAPLAEPWVCPPYPRPHCVQLPAPRRCGRTRAGRQSSGNGRAGAQGRENALPRGPMLLASRAPYCLPALPGRAHQACSVPGAFLASRGGGCHRGILVSVERDFPMQRFLAIAFAGLALSACDVAAPGAAELDLPQVEAGELSEATMKEITRTLSSDEFGGRMPGTEGEEKTVAYLIEKFEAAGLQPGNNGSWVQDVPLVEITARDFAPLTVSGDGVDLSFAPSG